MIKSLYVHIPFCVKKCLYCDFNSYSNQNLQDSYVDALIHEIELIEVNKFSTIFVGGGTPTILSLKNLEKLLTALEKFNPVEYTFESNPGTINRDKVKLLLEHGVNRLSIGLQAWQENLLKKLGRIHNLKDFLDTCYCAREMGFKNINIDLMFGIPDQTVEDWKETLNNIIMLNPEHISAYGLIIEEGTPYFELYNSGKLNLVKEDDERNMYHHCIEFLHSAGYKQYEISNFSKPQYECKHNITYWMDEEYIGAGAGAHSYVSNRRYSNVREIDGYIDGMKSKKYIESTTDLSLNDEISEFMFLGLRMTEGIYKERFKQRFGTDIHSLFDRQIINLKNLGLIAEDNASIKLTRMGIDLSNQVFVEFLL